MNVKRLFLLDSDIMKNITEDGEFIVLNVPAGES